MGGKNIKHRTPNFERRSEEKRVFQDWNSRGSDRPETLKPLWWAASLLLQHMVDAKKLASELTEKLRNSTTVDWQFRDSVRARMRILIRQLLRKCKYPPEGFEDAIALVSAQAQVLADDWSAR